MPEVKPLLGNIPLSPTYVKILENWKTHIEAVWLIYSVFKRCTLAHAGSMGGGRVRSDSIKVSKEKMSLLTYLCKDQ